MKFFIYTWYFFRSVFLRGFMNTLRLLKAEPAYEKKFGIKTSAIKKSDSKEFYHYQGAGYLALLRILKEVFKETGGFEFTDIGCGKGRAVFVAEYCGYNTLTGIELDGELVEEAKKNSGSYLFKRKESTIEFITANALEYGYKNKPMVYFFFNPFNEDIMRRVLAKVLASTQQETWFIYMNPLYTQPFLEQGLKPVKEFKTGRYMEALVYKTSQRPGI